MEVNPSESETELQLIYNWIYMEVEPRTMYLIAELMDAIYLHNKFSKPCSWDTYFPLSPSLTTVGAKSEKLQITFVKIGELQICIASSDNKYLSVGQFGKFGPKNRFFIPNYHHPKSP